MASLKSVFEEYFQIVLADTPALRDTVFRLRYQIYCMETGFERPEDFPDGLEKDAFDGRAVHSLLQHKASGDEAQRRNSWSRGNATHGEKGHARYFPPSTS